MMAFTMVPRAVLLLGTLCCASAFTLTPSLSTSTGVMTRSVMPLRMQSKGFGQGSANQKKISTVGKDRKAVSFSRSCVLDQCKDLRVHLILRACRSRV